MSELLNTFKQILFKKKNTGFYQLRSELAADGWDVYPRPQLRRNSYLCLNDGWTMNEKPIKLPFCPQADLSGYECEAIDELPTTMLYSRTLVIPADFKKQENDRIILHFGAVDQSAQVFINNRPVMRHEGGYLPFEADITDHLHASGEENLISLYAEDTLDHFYPWGKQRKDRGGMWYTPVSGIWQTVWLEAVPETYITSLKMTPKEDGSLTLRVYLHLGKAAAAEIAKSSASAGKDQENQTESNRPKVSGCINWNFTIDPQDGAGLYKGSITTAVKPVFETVVNLEGLKSWTPEEPVLYPLSVSVEIPGICQDQVESYFALRTVDIRELDGRKRICLNGKPIFLKGVLDQGYWSDGLYLPANPSGYDQDILAMKAMGFNLLRKHIKVEPELFYYACDRLGMLVMQDMVNSGSYQFIRDTGLPTLGLKKQPEAKRKNKGREGERQNFFLEHSREMIGRLYNHPCIIAYTIFNEGWGQFASREVGDMLRQEDTTRIYDYTSGWFEHGGSDLESVHEYFHPGILKAKDKPMLLSETGGFSWMIPEHSYKEEGNYGYGSVQSREELMDKLKDLYETMIYPSIPEGLCGFIYTQVSDVEDEVNGLYTYDRRVCKADVGVLRALNDKAKL